MSQGKVNENLVTTLDFRVKVKVRVRMDDYAGGIIKTFPQKLKSTVMAIPPAGNILF